MTPRRRGIGRLTSATDASGSTAYVYDARGNVVQETHVIGGQSYITSYAYDLADHISQVTYPSGRIVSYTRDAMGRVSGVTTQANSAAPPVAVASGASYAPFGPLTGLTYGNGLGLSVTYDQDYQPQTRLVSGAATVQDLSYGFDSDGNITGIADLLDGTRSQTFQYDALNRLTYASERAFSQDCLRSRLASSASTRSFMGLSASGGSRHPPAPLAPGVDGALRCTAKELVKAAAKPESGQHGDRCADADADRGGCRTEREHKCNGTAGSKKHEKSQEDHGSASPWLMCVPPRHNPTEEV